ATSGIDEIQGGLEEVQTLLGNINDNEAVDQTGIHVPEEFLETDGIKDTVDQYSFGDDKALRMNVVLDVDPYSPESMNVLDDIESTVNNELQRLGREDTVAYFSGVTSMNRDLDEISTDDYTRVITICISTLFVILAIVFMSLNLPVTMIRSISVTYFASHNITQWLLGLLWLWNLSWAVPFFSLIIFAAH